ncbi:putative Fat-like cadherin-related tumor suppressor [Lucilia cuprina]|uniref:Putative Fat-like cadherin-related tumor suppressor n=1 Tax=Lucilia cuprina TaxID=7375 RepID=A0A0L0C098_LUCCU|nr:putative Fat-like cadherin-related tumor suppressor [Lucilia cuprina]
MRPQKYAYTFQCIPIVLKLLVLLLYIVQASCSAHNDWNSKSVEKDKENIFKFTRNAYNVTIPENSIGKTYAKPKVYDYKIGIEIQKRCAVNFRIVSGDKDKLFKTEERIIGNFAFLAIRTRTSNVVLNREKNEEYVLNIKAFISCPEIKPKLSYEDECTMYLQVLDRNDLSPLFYPTEYSATISEDLPIHSSILTVTAEDADLGLNGEIYYSFLDDNPYFVIHPSTGVISNVRLLEHLGDQQLVIVVLAVDRGSALNHYNHQSSKAKVHINIQKTNLFAPELHVTTLSNTVVNESIIVKNKVYGIIQVFDKDSGRNGEINSVKIISGDPNGNFRLTETETKGEYYINLNKLSTFNNSRNVFNLTIRVEDNGIPIKFSYKVVPIIINVEKNNGPVFTKQFYEVSIPETSPPNMPVIRLKVTDPDFGRNALVTLEIVGGNEGGEFRINPDSGMLYTQKALDAEKTSFYTLTVTAIDQANLGVRKQSSAKVKINILDINDNDPIFDDNVSTVSLNENELAGTFVTKVSARDNDSGENSYISYSIANLNDVPFDIDHFSGVIRTSSLIDYEVMRRSYKLRIRASDWGLPFRRQTEKEILIKINNINDNRPQFERVNCVGKISRNAPVGTDIFTLSAIDFDVGDYITYRLLSGNDDGCFNLDPTTGIITIGCDLKDVRSSHRFLNVSSTDGTHFSDEMTIEIRLLGNQMYEILTNIDENGYTSFECHETGIAKKLADTLATSERNNMVDKEINSDEYILMPSRYGQNLHNPEFINFPMELKINESLTLGETITWFKAKDRDLGYNGKLIFGISEGDFDSVFRVDPDSGELLLIGYLDRERQDEYVLNITVCDLGQPCKCASKMLTVTILDVNDNPPVIQKSLARFHLREDVDNKTQIFCLKATDADFGVNALIEFKMKTETTNFALNSTTGCLFVNGKLDREQTEEHKLKIVAKDKGYPSLSAEALISIILDDVNDNPPIFGVQEILFKVREDLPKGTMIAQIEASDFDSGINGEILFFLKEDTLNNSLFKIDKHSGVIRTQGYLDYENQQVHNLMVCAIDRGTPALTSNMPVVVEVIDVNENRFPPEFDDYVFVSKIKEDSPKGTVVMNISAKDLDEKGPNSEIEYFIRSGDGLGIFSVNDKGSIRTLSHLDVESKKFYWLTLCAQDGAIVPLVSCVQVYIEIENVNDNVPLTNKPVYYPIIKEGSPPKTRVILLNATDDDEDPDTLITYKIISGNPEGFFEINKTTGELLTTERKLDRENQAEHILEIYISDNGQPALYSTTRVVVLVDDINDNAPQFDQRFYKVQVPSSIVTNVSITQIQATDNDIGDNGKISYSIKSGKGKNKFRINSETGLIYVIKPLDPDGEYELVIKAEDYGLPRKSQTARLNVVVIPILEESSFPPKIKTENNVVEVTESDKPGFLVTLIQATDEDSDHLWYNISGGNENNEFYIGHDNGNVLLSKSLNWEFQKFYNLTISVADGTYVVKTKLYVHVVDTNDNRPQFTKELYIVNISESVKEESIIMQLHATDDDEEKKIFYTLHGSKDPSSLHFFRIDSVTGNVIVTQRLDYERIKRHVLTVIAKDQGTPAKRNYAKIIINVYDHNDHYPEFTSKLLQSKIPESSAIKSKVAQLNAIDRDSGKNGEIRYYIVSGNVGNIFEIDNILGTIYLSQNLDILQMQEYMLQVKAVDCGNPPLASQIPVHIIVTMSDNDPPKFNSLTSSIELYENLPVGYFVTKLETRSSSSVFYNIVEGNDEGFFYINPSTGVILVNSKIDYEKNRQFNLTIKGTNMASASSIHNAIVHILDVNDNIPIFIQTDYYGKISESSEPGTYVYCNDSQNSLIFLKTLDADAGQNSILEFTILDEISRQYFEIDSTTGTIKLLQKLDYESKTNFQFNVVVNDKGSPKLFSQNLANVIISVINVNDCPPEFTKKEVNVTLYLPTYEGVRVAQITAIDMDSNNDSDIRYDIVDGNVNNSFEINKFTGEITLRNMSKLDPSYALHVRASDGLFSAIAQVDINVKMIKSPNFLFQKEKYEFSAVENSTKISIIGIVNVIGNLLVENVEFRILNPTNLFEIGKTSGAIKTKGVVLDRESTDEYILIIEAVSLLYKNNKSHFRRAITQVIISILDVNDNCPIFVNLPYYATVSMEDLRGSVIINIRAIDLDANENGEVRYEMKKGNGELFKIDRKSGDISLKQNIDKIDKNYEIIVAAYDNALTPCYAEVPVLIKVVDKSMPIFNKQFYSVSIREDVELFSALSLSIQAESPLQRSLIFTISSGNDDEFFEIDYRTGILYLVNSLDFEKQRSYQLFITATDSVSGVYAEVPVSISVEDANDCYPLIEQENYNITLPENTFLGSQILKIDASDCDFDANSILSYVIESINGEVDSNLFYIDIADGSLYLKHQLNYEECKSYIIVISVNDHGTPSLRSRANVWIEVEDLNDNGPKFIEPSFSSKLSISAKRGQFVTIAKAYDADDCDINKLVYKIVDGNEHQLYSIEETTGLIILQNNQRLQNHKQTILNISVTDGLHTSFARVKINLLPENLHAPVFENQYYEAYVYENDDQDKFIVKVKAIDNDFGIYATLTYEIIGDDMNSIFSVDRNTGSLYTKDSLNREQKSTFDVIVKASDGGGKFGFTLVKVKVVDVNDNAPYFLLKDFKITVKHDVKVNSVIAKISAIDIDENNNSVLNYTMENSTLNPIYMEYLSLGNEGDLRITKSFLNFSNELIEFFVKATDNGDKPLSNILPVSLQVVYSNITIPSFEKAVLNINVEESYSPGSILAKLKVNGNFSVKISLVSESPKFSITENGEIMLMQLLDREVSSVEHIIAMSETSTVPPLYAYIDIFFNVQDENDNFPKFSNIVYNVEIPENAEKGSSVIKVTCVDADEGPNGDVRYYLEDETYSKIFEIDIYSGWITLLSTLDRESQSEYYFNVLASDNGQPKQISKAPVSITVLDCNDNPSIFKQNYQDLFVSENVIPGTVLSRLLVTDLDSQKNHLDFFIVSGDNYSQFQISNSGELFVSKKLDREFIENYNLSVAVTDGKFISYAYIFIIINDENDNFPICLKPRYNIIVNESTPVGSILVEIIAIDRDVNPNNKMRYYLTGNFSDDFFIDKDSGELKIAKQLDREKHSKYILLVHVQDGKELLKECVSEVIIAVSDVNDNNPEFSMKQYIVSIPEDAQINTIVTKIHATDKDFGLNRKLSYSFLEANDFFEITSSNGIIKLTRSLDRENTSIFNISLKAEDYGTPKLYSIANLTIHILDINDNPPVFNLKHYKTFLSEKSPIDSVVLKVHATSEDIGINAEILYLIIGGNEQQKFKIDSKTGVISVNLEIDYEKTKSFFLTVQAIDGGTPPLSSQAFVNITVLDINDNLPQFTQNLYRIRVAENTKKGQIICQITATDEDSEQNGIVMYHIERGDRLNQFSIDEYMGEIYINNDIDRETISSYTLEIRACDNGIPQLCSYVQVLIDVLDINDNPPLFKNSNYSIVLQENKPLGFIIITFELSDADDFPNSSPFTFDFKSGNEGGFFRLEQDGSLRTAARFNHRICDEYVLQIRVFDNGTPPLYSDTWISIKIIEESQYPPVITPLEITVNSYDDDFAGGFLGKIYVSDLDKYDTFTFELAATHGYEYSILRLFNISKNTGELFALKNLDIGLYQINVTVSDGKFISHAIVRLNVEIITNEMVKNSIIIKFGNVTPKDFILSHRKAFIRSIREIMRCGQKDVIIIALNHDQILANENNKTNMLFNSNRSRRRRSYNILEVVFTVQKQQIIPTSENYYSSDEIRYKILKKIEEIEYNSNLLVEELVPNECISSTCVHGECKKQLRIMKNDLHTYYTDVVSYVSPTYIYINNCLCKQGFDGKNCDEPINACSSDPCTVQKKCWPADTAIGYQCICPTGYSGLNCEIQAVKCQNNTCSNFQTPVSFSGKSYAHYKINKSVARSIIESQFSFSLNVRTVQQSGTLVYASGPIDYNIIEILNGALQYRFDLGSGEGLVVVSSVNISDGAWHTIKLERILNTAKVVVDSKHFSQGSAPGVNIILNLQTNDFFVGAEVKPHHTIIGYEDIHRGFIGCMTDLRIGNEMLPLYISGGSTVAALKRFTNVEFHCDPAKVLINLGICSSQPCLNAGFCQDLGDKFKCVCPERFSGKLCEVDLDPCASSPCLYGGHCEHFGPNNYSCICPSHLSGRRCEYGKFCSPNPCKNGGICEEGDGIPHCMCRGFTGTMCENDVDECENHPCGSGATCINEAGSFRCICPSYLTGASCGDPLYSNSISTKIRNFSMENITGIICGVTFVFIFCILMLLCIILKKNYSRTIRQNPDRIKNTYKETTLNSLLQKDKNNKQNTKLSNLEVNHRPISYTQSSTDNNMFSTNTHFVNNLDILRSYGSAGDELENIAFEYQKINLHNQNVNINNENISDVATSSYKTDWCDQMQLKTFCENKLNNGKPIDYHNLPLNRLTSIKSNCGKLIQVTMPNVCQSTFGGEYSSLGQYHWDCSDWVRNSHNPLPDITEVPAEIADSTSFDSNESNESKPKSTSIPKFSMLKVNPVRDISTLPEDLVSDSVDSELQDIQNIRLPLSSNSLSRLSPIYYSENEDYTLNSVNSDEAFLCNKSPYSSNISVHLCEIEDSELEEFLPKRKETPAIPD